jgi:DNA mismatch endonuclease (patch repair protein)
VSKVKKPLPQPASGRGTGIGDAGETMVATPLGFVTTPTRSAMMRKIKAKNTKAEVILSKELWRQGLRYRRNVAGLPGKPDIVFSKQKVAIFVDGEFWHGYQWEERKLRLLHNLEGERQQYWLRKIEKNMQRDVQYTVALEAQGWRVLRFWQRAVLKNLDITAATIMQAVGSYGQELYQDFN